MAKIRQPFGEPRVVPDLGGVIVEPDTVVEVPDGDLPHWLEGGWEPADDKTRKAGKALLDGKKITVLAGGKPAAPQGGEGAGGGDR